MVSVRFRTSLNVLGVMIVSASVLVGSASAQNARDVCAMASGDQAIAASRQGDCVEPERR